MFAAFSKLARAAIGKTFSTGARRGAAAFVRSMATKSTKNLGTTIPTISAAPFTAGRRLGLTLGSLGLAGAFAAQRSMCSVAEAKASYSDPNEMAFRVLGNSGLQVSVLSYGFWATYGAKADMMDQEGINKAKDILRIARKGGINLFDNAEAYGSGRAETIMGEAIQQLRREDPEAWRRSDILLTTKLFWGGQGVNEKGLSRKHLNEGMRKALKRLQTEYVDIVFCHRPDPFTPTATVVRAMSDLVSSGKATCWGTSEWSAQQITEAVLYANQNGLEPPVTEQPQYHVSFFRTFSPPNSPAF